MTGESADDDIRIRNGCIVKIGDISALDMIAEVGGICQARVCVYVICPYEFVSCIL